MSDNKPDQMLQRRDETRQDETRRDVTRREETRGDQNRTEQKEDTDKNRYKGKSKKDDRQIEHGLLTEGPEPTLQGPSPVHH